MPKQETGTSTRNKVFRLLAIVAGAAMLAIGLQERAAINDVRAVGKVSVVEPIADYTRRKSKGGDTYSAEFTFKTEEGKIIRKRRPFPQVLLADFENGVPVKVLYDPASPSQFVFEKEQPDWLPMGLGAAFIIGAVFF